jgi:hypothetical protein
VIVYNAQIMVGERMPLLLSQNNVVGWRTKEDNRLGTLNIPAGCSGHGSYESLTPQVIINPLEGFI